MFVIVFIFVFVFQVDFWIAFMMANTFVNMEQIGKESGREDGSKAMVPQRISFIRFQEVQRENDLLFMEKWKVSLLSLKFSVAFSKAEF